MNRSKIKMMWFAGWCIAARLWLFYLFASLLLLPFGLILNVVAPICPKWALITLFFLVFSLVIPFAFYLTAKWRGEFKDETTEVDDTCGKKSIQTK